MDSLEIPGSRVALIVPGYKADYSVKEEHIVILPLLGVAIAEAEYLAASCGLFSNKMH